MSRGPDPATRLCRAIEADAARNGCPIDLVETDWKRWASATFAGARHTLTLRAPQSDALDRWLSDLADAELPTRAMLVADLTVASVRHNGDVCHFTIEALTVDS